MARRGSNAYKKMSPADFVTPVTTMLVVTKPKALGSDKLRQVGSSGIVAPLQSEMSRSESGRICQVLQTGPEVTLVEKGDYVIVPEFAGQPLSTGADARECTLLAESEVNGIVDPEYFDWLDAISEDR